MTNFFLILYRCFKELLSHVKFREMLKFAADRLFKVLRYMHFARKWLNWKQALINYFSSYGLLAVFSGG